MRAYEAEAAVKDYTPGDTAQGIESLLAKRTPGVPRALNHLEWKTLEKAVEQLVLLEAAERLFRK